MFSINVIIDDDLSSNVDRAQTVSWHKALDSKEAFEDMDHIKRCINRVSPSIMMPLEWISFPLPGFVSSGLYFHCL